MKNLTVEQSHHERQANSSIPLIDVRTPAEYGSLHAESAQSHPMESLDIGNFPFSKDQEIHVICQSGGRSMKVCQKLESAGFERVVNVEGGTSAWDGAGLPVIAGKRPCPWRDRCELPRVLWWSLERWSDISTIQLVMDCQPLSVQV